MIAKYSKRFFVAHPPAIPRKDFTEMHEGQVTKVCCSGRSRGTNKIEA